MQIGTTLLLFNAFTCALQRRGHGSESCFRGSSEPQRSVAFYYLTLAVDRLIFRPLRKLLGFKLAGGSDVRLLLSSNESLSRANQPQIWFGYASISGSHYIIQDLHEKCG